MVRPTRAEESTGVTPTACRLARASCEGASKTFGGVQVGHSQGAGPCPGDRSTGRWIAPW